MKGRFNGGNPPDFVLDTGAEMTVMAAAPPNATACSPPGTRFSAGVGELGLRGLQLGRIDSLDRQVKISNVPALIKAPALGGIPMREAESFSPMALGMSMASTTRRSSSRSARQLRAAGEIEMPLTPIGWRWCAAPSTAARPPPSSSTPAAR